MKIDVFCHIFPKNFFDRMLSVSGKGSYMQKRVREIPVMVDLEARFRMMDRFVDYTQVISLAAPPIEAFGGDALPINSHRSFLNTRQLSATIVPANQISCTRRFL